MGHIVHKTIVNDEVNLLNYWRVIRKRKGLLFGTFFAIITGTVIINLLIPKTYRGEFIIETETKGLTVVFSNIHEKLKNVLPKTYQSVCDIQITALPDTLVSKFHILIDAKDTSEITQIASELFAYINNSPLYKRKTEQEKEQLQKEMNELSNAILYMEDALKNYTISIKSEKPASEVLNPLELHKGMIDFKKRKVILEQSLKNYMGVEINIKEIYQDPVAPKIRRNIILSVLIGILSGILLVFMAEFAEKVRTPLENKQQI